MFIFFVLPMAYGTAERPAQRDAIQPDMTAAQRPHCIQSALVLWLFCFNYYVVPHHGRHSQPNIKLVLAMGYGPWLIFITVIDYG